MLHVPRSAVGGVLSQNIPTQTKKNQHLQKQQPNFVPINTNHAGGSTKTRDVITSASSSNFHYGNSSSSTSVPTATALISGSCDNNYKLNGTYQSGNSNDFHQQKRFLWFMSYDENDKERKKSQEPKYYEEPDIYLGLQEYEEPDIYVGETRSFKQGFVEHNFDDESDSDSDDLEEHAAKMAKSFSIYKKCTSDNIHCPHEDGDPKYTKEAVFRRLRTVDIFHPSRRVFCDQANPERMSIKVDRGALIRESPKSFGECYRADTVAVGEGGFGVVFKAEHRSTKTVRAAKRIRKAVLKNDWEMFENEVKHLMALDHPHIVQLVEYFDEKDDVILIFELCQGPDLFDRLLEVLQTKKKFDDKEAGRLMRHMLKSIFCCHSLGIIHRDVKPENFMFATKECSCLKMIDLGLSAKIDENKVSMKEVAGTVAYMPPEMLQGDSYDRKCDIWSSGIILYMMLVGEPLFSLAGDDKVCKKQILDPKFLEKKLRKAEQKCSKDGVDLIKRMLARDPAQRFSAKDALNHPFIIKSYEGEDMYKKRGDAEGLKMSEVIERMSNFSTKPLLQRATFIVLAHLVGTDGEELQEHRLTFRKLDKDGSGSITMEEFIQGMLEEDKNLHIPDNFKGFVWPSVDLNQSDDINFTEFLASTIEASHFNEHHYLGVFQLMDVNNSGKLDYADLKELFSTNSDKDLDKMVKEVAPSGSMTFEEFKAAMLK